MNSLGRGIKMFFNQMLDRLEAAVLQLRQFFFRQDTVEAQVMTSTLFNLLKLFDEDLKDGALVIVRDGQTLLRRFIKP